MRSVPKRDVFVHAYLHVIYMDINHLHVLNVGKTLKWLSLCVRILTIRLMKQNASASQEKWRRKWHASCHNHAPQLQLQLQPQPLFQDGSFL